MNRGVLLELWSPFLKLKKGLNYNGNDGLCMCQKVEDSKKFALRIYKILKYFCLFANNVDNQ